MGAARLCRRIDKAPFHPTWSAAMAPRHPSGTGL